MKHLRFSTLFLLSLITSVACATTSASAQTDAFPPSTASAEGIDQTAIDRIDRLINTFVDEKDIVGGELLLIKNGRIIHHAGYGWSDRESETPMGTGNVFCVRSMTKPFIAASVLMLIEEGTLALDDHVTKYIPSFDNDNGRDITIEHLLTHTSGLPLSSIMSADLHELQNQGGIRAVAELGSNLERPFAPGDGFIYSDQGTDTLTAIVEIVSGMTAQTFVRSRLLEPLGMTMSTCVMTDEHPAHARAISKYVGTPGSWTRFWHPDDPALFPFFLGSQGLYATLEDYARFLNFWNNDGAVGETQLISPDSAHAACTPGPYPLGGPTGFPNARTDYGYLMQLWTVPTDNDQQLLAFGHTGSDGTHAWCFPEHNAMALYCTQSRGTRTGLRVETALAEIFLDADAAEELITPQLDQFLGYYWEGEGDLYRAIIRHGNSIALEVPGTQIAALTYAGDDNWTFKQNPSVVLTFTRDSTGTIDGYIVGGNQEFRFEPAPDLPDADELAQRVAERYRLGSLRERGPIRSRSTMTIKQFGMSGTVVTTLAAPNRFRIDTVLNGQSESAAFNGSVVTAHTSERGFYTLTEEEADSVRISNPLARYGNWRDWYKELHVIQRLDRNGTNIYLVRTGDASGPAQSLYVTEDGRLVRVDSLTHASGMGRIGQRITFGEFQDVQGMHLPSELTIDVMNPTVGRIRIEAAVDTVEHGFDIPDGYFELRDKAADPDNNNNNNDSPDSTH